MSDSIKGTDNGAVLSRRGRSRTFTDSFNIVLALYLIYYIFWNTRKLSDDFIWEDINGKATKLEFYKEVLCMSRQRFSRIMKQSNFHFSKDEQKRIEKMFNINLDFFDKRYIKNLLDVSQSKCMDYIIVEFADEKGAGTKEQEDNHKKVKEILKEKLEELDNGKYKYKNSSLYKIHYYFVNHRTYNRNESYTDIAIEALKKIKLDDWRKAGLLGELQEYADILGRHYKYLESYLCMKELIKNDKEKNPDVYI